MLGAATKLCLNDTARSERRRRRPVPDQPLRGGPKSKRLGVTRRQRVIQTQFPPRSLIRFDLGSVADRIGFRQSLTTDGAQIFTDKESESFGSKESVSICVICG